MALLNPAFGGSAEGDSTGLAKDLNHFSAYDGGGDLLAASHLELPKAIG